MYIILWPRGRRMQQNLPESGKTKSAVHIRCRSSGHIESGIISPKAAIAPLALKQPEQKKHVLCYASLLN